MTWQRLLWAPLKPRKLLVAFLFEMMMMITIMPIMAGELISMQYQDPRPVLPSKRSEASYYCQFIMITQTAPCWQNMQLSHPAEYWCILYPMKPLRGQKDINFKNCQSCSREAAFACQNLKLRRKAFRTPTRVVNVIWDAVVLRVTHCDAFCGQRVMVKGSFSDMFVSSLLPAKLWSILIQSV